MEVKFARLELKDEPLKGIPGLFDCLNNPNVIEGTVCYANNFRFDYEHNDEWTLQDNETQIEIVQAKVDNVQTKLAGNTRTWSFENKTGQPSEVLEINWTKQEQNIRRKLRMIF